VLSKQDDFLKYSKEKLPKKKKASHLKISLKIHVLLGSHDNSLLDYYLHLTNEDN